MNVLIAGDFAPMSKLAKPIKEKLHIAPKGYQV